MTTEGTRTMYRIYTWDTKLADYVPVEEESENWFIDRAEAESAMSQLRSDAADTIAQMEDDYAADAYWSGRMPEDGSWYAIVEEEQQP